MSSSVNNWFMIGAAFIGIVSAAGVMIAEHYRQERRKHSMALDLARLDRQVTSLRDQLELLKKKQHSSGETRTRQRRHNHPKASSAMSTLSDDYNSTRELDSSDMEFYDLSDDETSRASTITPLDTVLRDVDDKLDGGGAAQLSGALETLEGMLLEHPECPDVLWRIGKAYYKMAVDPETANSMMELIGKAVRSLEQALFLNGDCFEAHKWMAMSLGLRMDNMPLRERIKDCLSFKRHLDAAIAVRTNDTALLHSLGRYHFEIASMKWYERKVFAAICGDVPDCSIDEAIRLLLEVERLYEPSWKDNKLAVAKCYISQGNYPEALKYLNEARSMQPFNLEDSIDAEIESLLSKYKGYR